MVVDITIGLVGIIFFIYLTAKQIFNVNTDDLAKKDFFNILGVLLNFFSFLIITILAFVLMDASTLESFFPVLRALFISIFIFMGLISTVGTLVCALLAMLFGYTAFFRNRFRKDK